MRSTAHRVGTAVAVALALPTAAVLLWPDGEVVRRGILDLYLALLHRGVPPAVTPEVYAAVLNVLAFVPLGWLGVVALGRSARTVVAVLVALSACVELLQTLPWLSREPSVVDVLLNGAGALVGALLGTWATRSDRREALTAARGPRPPGAR